MQPKRRSAGEISTGKGILVGQEWKIKSWWQHSINQVDETRQSGQVWWRAGVQVGKSSGSSSAGCS